MAQRPYLTLNFYVTRVFRRTADRNVSCHRRDRETQFPGNTSLLYANNSIMMIIKEAVSASTDHRFYAGLLSNAHLLNLSFIPSSLGDIMLSLSHGGSACSPCFGGGARVEFRSPLRAVRHSPQPQAEGFQILPPSTQTGLPSHPSHSLHYWGSGSLLTYMEYPEVWSSPGSPPSHHPAVIFTLSMVG